MHRTSKWLQISIQIEVLVARAEERLRPSSAPWNGHPLREFLAAYGDRVPKRPYLHVPDEVLRAAMTSANPELEGMPTNMLL